MGLGYPPLYLFSDTHLATQIKRCNGGDPSSKIEKNRNTDAYGIDIENYYHDK